MIYNRNQQVREALNRRYFMVFDWKADTSPDILAPDTPVEHDFFLQAAAFVELIVTTPELRSTFLRLIDFHKDIEQEQSVQEALNAQFAIIQRRSAAILKNCDPESIDSGTRSDLENWARSDFGNDITRDSFDHIDQKIRKILSLAGEEVSEKILSELNDFDVRLLLTGENTVRAQLDDRLKFLAHYYAADSARILRKLYLEVSSFGSPHLPLEQEDNPESHIFLKHMLDAKHLSYGVEEIRGHCKKVYNSMLDALDLSISKSFVIERLRLYCEWFKRDSIRGSLKKARQKESILQTVVEEFVFQSGYFPVVHFKMGSAIPDVLADGGYLPSVLIELKQMLGKSLNARSIESFITQTRRYAGIVRSQPLHANDEVFLVVFYEGDKLPVLKGETKVSLEADQIFVTFVYIGTHPPSKLKGTLQL